MMMCVNTEFNMYTQVTQIQCQGSDLMMHGLFVDDMMHVPTSDNLRDEFLAPYQKDFEITGGGLIKTFLGIEVEQPG